MFQNEAWVGRLPLPHPSPWQCESFLGMHSQLLHSHNFPLPLILLWLIHNAGNNIPSTDSWGSCTAGLHSTLSTERDEWKMSCMGWCWHGDCDFIYLKEAYTCSGWKKKNLEKKVIWETFFLFVNLFILSQFPAHSHDSRYSATIISTWHDFQTHFFLSPLKDR